MDQQTELSSQNPEAKGGARPFIKELQLRNGELIGLPSVHIENMRLFTGSPVSGIDTFRDSEETTIGDGVYLTSQKDAARGYALVRGHRSPATPTLYEVEVADLDMIDLTRRIGVENFAKLWKQELIEWRTSGIPVMKVSTEIVRDIYKEKVHRVIELIDQNKIKYLRELLVGFGGIVRKVLAKQGYDGLIGLEGGEYGNGVTIGDHDSYVIFDPTRVKKVNEELVKKSD